MGGAGRSRNHPSISCLGALAGPAPRPLPLSVIGRNRRRRRRRRRGGAVAGANGTGRHSCHAVTVVDLVAGASGGDATTANANSLGLLAPSEAVASLAQLRLDPHWEAVGGAESLSFLGELVLLGGEDLRLGGGGGGGGG